MLPGWLTTDLALFSSSKEEKNEHIDWIYFDCTAQNRSCVSFKWDKYMCVFVCVTSRYRKAKWIWGCVTSFYKHTTIFGHLKCHQQSLNYLALLDSTVLSTYWCSISHWPLTNQQHYTAASVLLAGPTWQMLFRGWPAGSQLRPAVVPVQNDAGIAQHFPWLWLCDITGSS